MYVVIQLPDAKPEEAADMVKFVATEMETGQNFGMISPEFRWSIESEIS